MRRLIKMPAGIWPTMKDIFKCLGPFGVLLLAFGSLRSISPELNERIHYDLMPNADKLLFGGLPTAKLQHLLWNGHVLWYDYVLYTVYVCHYILPIFLAWIIYKKYHSEYLRLVIAYVLATFTAFAIFIIYPTAPPWLASQNGYIPHITRISSNIFSSIGVHGFSRFYSSYAPDAVAAVPSLHTTYAVLFVLFAYRVFGKKFGTVSLIYPFCIIFGVVYMGEHYFFDILMGTVLAVSSYMAAPVVIRSLKAASIKLPAAALSATAGGEDGND